MYLVQINNCNLHVYVIWRVIFFFQIILTVFVHPLILLEGSF